MPYLIWLLRFVLFMLLLGLGIKNNQPVTLHYFLQLQWHTSLVMLLLLFFMLGVAVTAFALIVNVLQQRREIARLQAALLVQTQLAAVPASGQLSFTSIV
ncbi:MAG: lipopolysaccharide assembly protein LapA domain-containing protein [Sideroxydans sp.]|nr:lipopolysaccharide assembly protein LapA domain-containing protein [Sideroxydans sp.]